MKKIVLILMLSWIAFSSSAGRYGNFGFSHPVLQEWETWCVHACIEMLSYGRVTQCESASLHASLFQGPHSMMLDCCDNVLETSIFPYCVIKNGVDMYNVAILVNLFEYRGWIYRDFSEFTSFSKAFLIPSKMYLNDVYLPTIVAFLRLSHAALLTGFWSDIIFGKQTYFLYCVNPAVGQMQIEETDNPDSIVLALI